MKQVLKQQLDSMCAKVLPPDERMIKKSKAHWDHIAKPLNGLGRFESMISRIAGIQGRENPELERRAVVVFCSDNGVVEEGVTQTDSSVTAVVAENFARGIASVNRMAVVAGAEVIPVDIGVSRELTEPGIYRDKPSCGTANFCREPAMSEEQALQAIHTGIRLAGQLKDAGNHLLATGEMGIGNTTTASAVASVLLGVPACQVTGQGAGLSRTGVIHKAEVIERGIALHRPDPKEPLKVLSALGGYDIAGMTGMFLGGAIFHIPVIIDGMISAVAALLAARLCPAAVSYMFPSHLGKEPADSMILEELGLQPVICGDLALGEGTGAVMLFPLLDMAASVYRANSTFDDIKIKAYETFTD